MRKLFILIPALSLMIIFACAEKVDIESNKEAVANARDQLIDALNTDDVDGIMAGLTDDHITMAPNEPALADMVKLRNHHEERIENYTLNYSFTTDEIEILGDWAFERFSSAVTVTPRSGDVSMNSKSKGIWIWKRQTDGTWKLARSIWNSDLPLPDSK